MNSDEKPRNTAPAMAFLAMEDAACKAVAARLGGAATGQVEVLLFSPEILAAACEKASGAVVVFRRAADAVADALARGTMPSVALAEWVAAMQALLQIQRRNRRRIHLVEQTHFLQAPAESLQGLFDRFTRQAPPPVVPSEPSVDPLLSCLAAQICQTSKEARDLEAELDAGGLSGGGASSSADAVDLAYRHVQTLEKNTSELQARLTEMKQRQSEATEESSSLRAQIDTLRSERDCERDRVKADAAALAHLKTESDLLRAQLALVQVELDGAREEITDLKRQLSDASETRATQVEAVGQLGQERDLLRAKLTQAQKDLLTLKEAAVLADQQIDTLRSERDCERDRVKADAATLADLKTESDLLHAHLALVQVESDGMREQVTDLQGQVATARSETERVRQELEQALAAETEQAGALAQMQIELQRARKDRQAMQQDRAPLIEQLSEASARNMAQFNQIKRLNQDLAKARIRLAETDLALQQAGELTQELKERAATLEAERDQMIASRSWNVTKPLRIANRILGGSGDKGR